MKPISIRSVAASLITAALLTLAGCGGGGSSSSGGSGGNFTGGTTMVKGNVSSVSAQASRYDSSGVDSYVKLLGDSLVPPAHADGRTIEGINACILERCDITDANGNFEINLAGFESGEYVLRFIIGEKEYFTRIEVVANAVITLDVSITDDGVVRISNVRVELIEEGPGPGEDHVVMCHKEEGQEPRTIEVPISQKGAHLEHGDNLGECGGGPPVEHFLICHVSGDDQVTLEVNAEDKEVHFNSHDFDYPGECEPIQEEHYLICHHPGEPDQEHLEVNAEQKAAHLGHGDSLGECPEVQYYLICHSPGEPGQEHLEVTAEQKLAHLAHGDDEGECEPFED